MFISERERQSASKKGAERKGDTESEAGPRLWAVSTESDVGLEPTNREIMTWAEVRHLTGWAAQAPLHCFSFNNIILNFKIASASEEGVKKIERAPVYYLLGFPQW